jgi:hypothetical protein
MQEKVSENVKNSNFSSSNNKEVNKFKFLLEQITEEYIKKFEQIQQKQSELSIPTTIFNKNLSPLETVSKYLIENLNLTIKKVSKLLNRSQKTIWQAYKNSKKKHKKSFEVKESKFFIPVSILNKRKFSILELVVSFLFENYNLNYHKIGTLLKRNERTVWTVYARVKQKRR